MKYYARNLIFARGMTGLDSGMWILIRRLKNYKEETEGGERKLKNEKGNWIKSEIYVKQIW